MKKLGLKVLVKGPYQLMSSFYKDLESQEQGQTSDLSTALNELKYNEAGLIPAIAQQHDTGEVLMMAWMNKHSIEETLQTGKCVIGRDLETITGEKAKALETSNHFTQ